MIIIPALGRTRSSLVAGIFHACGAWVGDTTISTIRQYDAFENWDVILYLQEKFALRSPMRQGYAELHAPAFREFVSTVVPHDRVVCLKFVWYYHHLFRCAFPEADFYFVRRDFINAQVISERQQQRWWTKRIKTFKNYENNMADGTWIDSEKLRVRDFSEIQPIIDQYSALQWNQQGVDTLYASCGAAKYANTKRMRR